MDYDLSSYEAKDGWRWRLRNARNKKIVAEGGEAYASSGNLKRALRRLPFDWKRVNNLVVVLLVIFLASCATPPEVKTLSVAQIGYFDVAIGAVRTEGEALVLAADTIRKQAEAQIDVEVARTQSEVATTLATTLPNLPPADRATAAARLLAAASAPALAGAESKARLQARLDLIRTRAQDLQKAIEEMKNVQVALDAYLSSAGAGSDVSALLLGSPGVQGILSRAGLTMERVKLLSADLLSLFAQGTP